MERQRQSRIRQGMGDIDRNFAGFNQNFYDKAAADYTAATTPGMFKDYQTTKNNLTYSLARNGILNGSAATQRNQSLTGELAKNESVIANNAMDRANQVRGQVNTQKSQLVQQLESSADPAAINAQSTAAASQLRAPSAIQPLGNLFADWSQMYLSNKFNPSNTGGNVWSNLANSGYGNIDSGRMVA